MNTVFLSSDTGINDKEIYEALRKGLKGRCIKKALLLPPDVTRSNSYAGTICAMLYELLSEAQVDIMPALGTHVPMTEAEAVGMYPALHYKSFIEHRWREDIIKLGEVPAEYINEVSEGCLNVSMDVELNRRLLDNTYDIVISIGQVVPHEVVGMANYNKNLFVGCGGSSMINYSHMLGALYGMERIMGRDHSPVRKVFDYAQEHFVHNMPLMYVMTVTTQRSNDVVVNAVSIGNKRDAFEKCVEVSQQKNITFLDKPLKKVVAYLPSHEFRTTWLGNKAIYRTRMAIADDGELIILAPGVKGCGEDLLNDKLIRRVGYVGRDRILQAVSEDDELKKNLSVAAHLIHGSSEQRFQITYAAGGLSKDEIELLNYNYMTQREVEKYNVKKLKPGFNIVDGEEVYYIPNPAIGLWAVKDRFFVR